MSAGTKRAVAPGEAAPPCPRREIDVRTYRGGGATFLVQRIDRYRTNEVGGYIWSLCDGETPVDDIENAVALRYGIDPGLARSGVRDFLSDLGRCGFLIRPD
ncbi:PqqD family protein [Streptomyces sp. NPDC058665]|uniref:PqqD family protein n=1 Tax=Streptomyces sp. NPDC058665 TaxID=3346586 RepID=UPI00364DD74A